MPCDGGASVAAGAVVLHPSVAEALASGGAVVALESTIVSHGMPYPQNLQMARDVEAIVRARGATPATVAIIDGVPRVGLDDADLRRLAELGARARKVSMFLSQPFSVAEIFTGFAGKFVPLETAIKDFGEVLNGDYDDLPEAAFYMVGGIDDVVEKAKTL